MNIFYTRSGGKLLVNAQPGDVIMVFDSRKTERELAKDIIFGVIEMCPDEDTIERLNDVIAKLSNEETLQ